MERSSLVCFAWQGQLMPSACGNLAQCLTGMMMSEVFSASTIIPPYYNIDE